MSLWGWVIVGFATLFAFPLILVSFVIFYKLLLRSPTKIGERFPCFPKEKEYMAMWEKALQWRNNNSEHRQDVTVTSGKLKLSGEYYDFGGESAVIVLPGRTECCIYSAFFAEPYKEAKVNVLLVDTRGTGHSEGWLNCLGFREWRDVLCWAELLHGELHNSTVMLHGICIGCCTALRTCVQPSTPNWITGMVAEGMFQCFYDTTKNHMIDSHKPTFPALQGLIVWIRMFCGSSAVTDGPKRDIKAMHRPLLMLHSREDIFSTPEKAQELFDWCPSELKSIHWFKHGRHSRVRLTNTDEYDTTVTNFIHTIERECQ